MCLFFNAIIFSHLGRRDGLIIVSRFNVGAVLLIRQISTVIMSVTSFAERYAVSTFANKLIPIAGMKVQFSPSLFRMFTISIIKVPFMNTKGIVISACLLYTSDAADE